MSLRRKTRPWADLTEGGRQARRSAYRRWSHAIDARPKWWMEWGPQVALTRTLSGIWSQSAEDVYQRIKARLEAETWRLRLGYAEKVTTTPDGKHYCKAGGPVAELVELLRYHNRTANRATVDYDQPGRVGRFGATWRALDSWVIMG